MSKFWNSFWSDESGQGLTEYAVIVGLVSIALVVLLGLMSDELGNIFREVVTQLRGVAPAQQAGPA